MKKIYGDILKIQIVCSIIAFLCIELTLVFEGLLPSNAQRKYMLGYAKDKVLSGETLNDMEGYGVIFNSIGGALHTFACIMMFILCIVVAVTIFIYVFLYFVSWKNFKEKENKDKVISSLVLTSVAFVMQFVIIYYLSKYTLFNDTQILLAFLVADISEIISVIFTMIILIFNRKEIKKRIVEK